MEHEVRDRNEWFKDVKRLMRSLEVETVENPFAWPTTTRVVDGGDVLYALGLHPSRDVGGIVNVCIDEVHELVRLIEPGPVTGSTSDDRRFIKLYDDSDYEFIVNMDKIAGVCVESKRIWFDRKATLDICDKSMDYLCRRLVGDGE